MKTIITECGKLITDQQDILNEQTKFFKKLYTKCKEIEFSYLNMGQAPKIDEPEHIMCDSKLSINELYDGITTLRLGQCPGGDGLPNEFYFTFFKQLGPHLLAMANHAYETGIFPQSTRRGLISLLPKKLKDTRFVKNTRPLTMLNSDYKVIAKALDNRIRTVITRVNIRDTNWLY